MKKINLKLNEETKNYLQRLGFEIDAKSFIIDKMFSNHKNDTDYSLFESIPFKKYMKEFEELNAEYNLAKEDLSKKIKNQLIEELKIDSTEEISFDWNIPDFANNTIEVKIY